MTNGVKQGGILSPVLFNLYMDGLSKRLTMCRTGCMVGERLLNHLMYADDLVIMTPSQLAFSSCSECVLTMDSSLISSLIPKRV